jgi:hypothetical protein
METNKKANARVKIFTPEKCIEFELYQYIDELGKIVDFAHFDKTSELIIIAEKGIITFNGFPFYITQIKH